MEKRELTCIECPMGCKIQVEVENGVAVSVSGNGCPRGKLYSENEVVSPKRVITTTVKRYDGKVVPVKTDKPVKKSEIFDIMKKINEFILDKNAKIGDIIIENLSDDANLVVTANID